jgi:hypothetical protein
MVTTAETLEWSLGGSDEEASILIGRTEGPVPGCPRSSKLKPLADPSLSRGNS